MSQDIWDAAKPMVLVRDERWLSTTRPPDNEAVDESLTSAWEFQATAAHDDDEVSRKGGPKHTWVPPNLAALVAAARATTLTRFYPFTACSALCLSDGPRFWDGAGEVAPAFISRHRDGQYFVWRGGPYREGATLVLASADPDTAAAELERLLARWPALPD